MAWDDDEWPEPERDPEKLARAHETFDRLAATRRRALRWAYAAIAVLVIVIVVVALVR